MLRASPYKTRLPPPEACLPGRDRPLPVPERHAVLGTPLAAPPPTGMAEAWFALGCFWGAEKRFWSLPGVYSTAVGYAGGHTPNPYYEEVCSGLTAHAEAVRVVYDPARIDYPSLLRVFWTAHDPTQGMRQGNDVGTQYRSVVFVHDAEQRRAAEASRAHYQRRLSAAGYGPITTTIEPARVFYFAEPVHQQYLAKHPWGYCGLGGTGVPYEDEEERS
ncbi:MAG: peptide methionine sulfoxide reductase MsrA [Gammaproteobacteria bacterium]|nr:MAG: peptide methionine sulfoxide reductase MsrA [Gammaproteobacteria bacterium]